MKYVGAHVSISGGVENAPLNASKIGANAFALFTKSPRQWTSKPLTKENTNSFKVNLLKSGISSEHVLPHDGYLINIGNPDLEKREKSVITFIDEAKRVEQLGLSVLNFHPGSHLGEASEEESLALIAKGVNKAITETEKVVFVLETTAGQGTNLGYTFEQLAYIIDRVVDRKRVGVCIDTCHIYAAGYDIKNKYHDVMNSFGNVLGFDLLKGVHLNDSKSKLGQKLDRHHSIGDGELGWDVFKKLMNDPRFDNIPLILETINSDIWEMEIQQLYALIE
nr:deoxyribonuclease IV [Desulfobulbaceae bacterium]